MGVLLYYAVPATGLVATAVLATLESVVGGAEEEEEEEEEWEQPAGLYSFSRFLSIAIAFAFGYSTRN